MVILPKAFALTLCDRLEVDPSTGKVSLVGIFNRRGFGSYPTDPQAFTVYTVLYDGLGQGTLKLRIIQGKMDADILVFQRWSSFVTRLQMVNLEVRIERCIFPEVGRYSVELSF